MRITFYLLLFCISTSMFGQERPIRFIDWETKEIPISLSKKEQIASNFSLPEIDFTVDIRKQGLRRNITPIVQLDKNQYITQRYDVAIPKVKFTINRDNYTNLSNSDGVKNIAYKDASLYSGYFCPVTGVALSQ